MDTSRKLSEAETVIVQAVCDDLGTRIDSLAKEYGIKTTGIIITSLTALMAYYIVEGKPQGDEAVVKLISRNLTETVRILAQQKES
jgi:hypothetical protein